MNLDTLKQRLPDFDLDNIILMLGGQPDAYLLLLQPFYEDFQDQAQRLTSLLAKGDVALAEKSLHTFKGVVGNLGAQELYTSSALLDSELKQGYYAEHSLQQWLGSFTQTMNTIAELLNSASTTPDTSPDTTELPQLLQDLAHRLAEDDFIESELLQRIHCLLPAAQQADFQLLRQCIEQTDYVTAHALLRNHILQVDRVGD